ncbi:MAG TPA: cbb3-type cytochrome oxidase assembly protein CcoS [Steroidobacteraceae bacterium]|nr:cbb3-type cytochrome oxidase assembly protein CcoS [Steroidobacteraceae bacterium]
MNIVFVLVPVTLILVSVGLWAFFWAVRCGQFDELDVASWEILVDERTQTPESPSGTLPP